MHEITGELAGHNTIRSIENGCAIEEKWVSTQGHTGTSISFFNAATSQWRQIWVSASVGGYRIDIQGGLDDTGRMVMTGDIHYFADQRRLPMRAVWTPESGGSVTQFMQQKPDAASDWETWFNVQYFPATSEP